MTLVEICLEDVGGARTAAQAGADALEVCAGLVEGGTTPTPGFVRHCVEEAPELVVPFKRQAYERVVEAFRPFAAHAGRAA